MKRSLLASFVVVVSLALVGCKGEQGPQGSTGLPGQVNATTYNGVATSNSYVVNIPTLNVAQGDLLSVYACTTTNVCEQLNIYQPGATPPTNLGYVEVPGQVTLIGLLSLTPAFPNYDITVIWRH